MILDTQKASMWKRISAWLFDFILIGIVIVGAATGLSALLRYDAHYESLEACYDQYEQAYGIDLDISNEDYEKLSDEMKQRYLDAGEKMQTDAQIRAYSERREDENGFRNYFYAYDPTGYPPSDSTIINHTLAP